MSEKNGNARRKRTRYDDKFRANAVLTLEAAGYPNTPGALAAVAKRLRMPETTLHGWAREKHNPPPTQLRSEKKGELIDWIKEELGCIFTAMPGARPDASYRDLGTVAGILTDKLQLLTGKPTDIIQVDNVSDSDIIREFSQLLDAARERAGRPTGDDN